MKSVKFREYAQDCLAMADVVASEGAKAFLISMAQHWHGLALAQEAEETERTGVVWAPGEEASP